MARQRPSTRPPGHRWAANHHRDDDLLAPSQGKVVPDASDRELLAHGHPGLPAIPRAGRYLGAWPAKSTESPYGYPNRWESASPRRPPVEDLPIYRLHALANR
jgi:hypothetical protein